MSIGEAISTFLVVISIVFVGYVVISTLAFWLLTHYFNWKYKVFRLWKSFRERHGA